MPLLLSSPTTARGNSLADGHLGEGAGRFSLFLFASSFRRGREKQQRERRRHSLPPLSLPPLVVTEGHLPAGHHCGIIHREILLPDFKWPFSPFVFFLFPILNGSLSPGRIPYGLGFGHPRQGLIVMAVPFFPSFFFSLVGFWSSGFVPLKLRTLRPKLDSRTLFQHVDHVLFSFPPPIPSPLFSPHAPTGFAFASFRP